ncbi:transferase CAF17, mitochondrial [Phlyctema vagabunda]|uniref:Iron-sulfur cluster assembly factor IBA57 homolog, mitochondrial n=1 Tax=Phlyctema vagabunda TaxID=108571 RepID=A0ABR4PK69_9HELO
MKGLNPISQLPRAGTYICKSCLSSAASRKPSLRQYSSSSNPPPPSIPSSGYAQLPTRRLISLSGPDSTHFLQGVITSNISASAPRTTGFYTAFLNAQGRVVNDVFIYPYGRDGTSWFIEVDAAEAAKLAKHIKRYKLRAKFDVRLLDEGERSVWSAWSDAGAWTQHSLVPESKDGGVVCEDQRAPGMGQRLILPSGEKPQQDLDEYDELVYRVRRYLKGVPEGQGELLREQALVQESNIDYMGGVDYRKGCYVGQELTIRTHHTGVVRKRILPLMLYGKDEAMPTSLEYSPEKNLAPQVPAETSIGRFEKRGRSAGKWLAGVGNIGLGLCRLEIMTDTLVQGEAGAYQEGDEFKLEWTPDIEGATAEMVKAKAFVPSWHLKK